MSRQLDVTGRHVYDSERDAWFGPFDTEEEALAYSAELVDPIRTEEVYVQAAPIISAYNVGLIGSVQNFPVEVVSFNPARIATRIKYVGTGVCLIGSKEAIASGQGYALTSGSAERFEVSASICATVNATFAGTVYVFNEEIAAPN